MHMYEHGSVVILIKPALVHTVIILLQHVLVDV